MVVATVELRSEMTIARAFEFELKIICCEPYTVGLDTILNIPFENILSVVSYLSFVENIQSPNSDQDQVVGQKRIED